MVRRTSEQQNTKALEAKVGGLVWVQRRNGTWWPGQILGLDDVSESCPLSPKSVTPIKLLCRDDVTVDWYNLEKSRQVKAFRCGEYGDCIEKAKASAANSSKKASKYSKREKAILHALELESALVFKDHEDCSSSENADSGPWDILPEVSPVTSTYLKNSDCMSEKASTFGENSNSAQELSHSVISYEETNGTAHVKGQPMKGRKQRDPNESDDEGTNRIKRMRGLDDLGLAGFSGKANPGGLTDAVSQGNDVIDTVHSMSVGSMVNGVKDTILSFKRKRSQLPHVHEFLKRKHRHRMLTKVLDTLVNVPIIFDEFYDSKVLGLESSETQRTISLAPSNVDVPGFPSKNENGHAQNKLKDSELSDIAFFNDDGDVGDLIDVPIDIEELHAGCSPLSLKLHSGAFAHNGQNCKAETISLDNRAVNEFDPTSVRINHVGQKLDQSTSKWQIKGKRNLRHSSKTECLDVDPDDSNALAKGMDLVNPFSPSSNYYAYRSTLSLNEDGFLDGKQGVYSKGISLRTDGKHFLDSPSFHNLFPYCFSRFSLDPGLECPETGSLYADSMLYDVNIEVKANYRPQHVPYISLMSKLNGKAITGHPVMVEVMDDGYCDSILDSSDYNPTSSGCVVGDDEEADEDYEVKPKGHGKPQSQPSPSKSKSSKSKKHGSSSKKTRRLSAFTRPSRSTHGKGKSLIPSRKGPTLACIPLKIVFSRIYEALNGSARCSHRATIQ